MLISFCVFSHVLKFKSYGIRLYANNISSAIRIQFAITAGLSPLVFFYYINYKLTLIHQGGRKVKNV